MDMTIRLNLDSDAFKQGNGPHEVYQVLHGILIDTDMLGEIRSMDENLRDLNGNTVGRILIE